MMWAKSWHTPRRALNASAAGVLTSVALESNVNSVLSLRINSPAADRIGRPEVKLARV